MTLPDFQPTLLKTTYKSFAQFTIKKLGDTCTCIYSVCTSSRDDRYVHVCTCRV